jgi:hypothetical protein
LADHRQRVVNAMTTLQIIEFIAPFWNAPVHSERFSYVSSKPQESERETDPILRGGTAGAPPRDTAEVLDPSGRRALLFLTDGVGDGRREEILYSVLARWGRTMAVSVVDLLPQWLWRRGRLPLHNAWSTAPADLRPNAGWHLDLPDAWLTPDPGALSPRFLHWWADLITGTHCDSADGTVLLTGETSTRGPSTRRKRSIRWRV